jgi:uncharacterized protein YrrD
MLNLKVKQRMQKEMEEKYMTKSNGINGQKLVGNPVIDVNTGEIVAKVDDVQVDPQALEAAVVITSKGSLLSRDIEAVLAEHVEVWGQDAILIKQPDAIVKEEQLEGRDAWLSVSDDIRKFEVVAEDGTRIGTLNDVVINLSGKIMGYEMDEVAIEGQVASTDWIDVEATRSLGPDVLIITSDYK